MTLRAWFGCIGLATLTACQVVTGLDGLQVVDAGERSSSSSVRGSDAGGRDSDAAIVIGPDGTLSDAGCVVPRGATCDPAGQCGCKFEMHCQARGAAYSGSCVPPGPLEPGSVCANPGDCPRGQTCDDRVCRPYCREDADCTNGICVGLQGKDPKAKAVHVCWTECTVGNSNLCGPGAGCRMLQNERGESAGYCAAPADPCPTIEDGVCDDSRGTRACVDGSDAKDCDCQPQLPDARCDPVAQCGCPKADACVVSRDPKLTAACTMLVGEGTEDAPCKADSDCAAGLVCELGGTCAHVCKDDSSCDGRVCLPAVLSGMESSALKLCYARCDRMKSDCAQGQRCAHFDARFAAEGDFCMTPFSKCPFADGVCDEARGSGLCANESDVIDCCEPSLMGGECDLVRQCGCEKEPGSSCREGQRGDITHTTTCGMPGPTPVDNWCLDDSSCAAGLGCSGHVCRRYCLKDADCGAGARCIAMPRDGGTDVRLCLGPCDPGTNSPCGEHTLCRTGNIENAPATGCTFVPLTTDCPTDNARCDEPEGTGICAEASDPGDCVP